MESCVVDFVLLSFAQPTATKIIAITTGNKRRNFFIKTNFIDCYCRLKVHVLQFGFKTNLAFEVWIGNGY